MKPKYLVKIYLGVLLVSFLSSGISQPAHGNPIQKTLICGVVTNFEDPYELPPLELIKYMPFISEWNIYSCFIEKDGVFRFEFEQLYPAGIMIKFKEMFSVFANPGDSIHLLIDAGMLSDTSDTRGFEYSYIQISSPKQKFQNDYQSFTQSFYSKFGSYDNYLDLKDAQKKLDPSSYSRYISNRSIKYNTYLEEYINTNTPSNEFQVWANNWLYLKEIDDLMRYSWLHPKYNELDEISFRLPDEYFEFLKDQRHNDEKLFNSQQYRSFLHELYMYIYLEFQQSEIYNQFDTLYNSGEKAEAYRLLLNHIVESSSGFEQEYFVSRFFSRLIFWKFLDTYDALYDPRLIGRDDYNQILANEYADLQMLIAEPIYAKDLNLYDSSISEEQLVFKTLPDRFPNKVIYVDFWAPWCGPCMAEMPHSKELQEKLKEKEVVFVFLAGRCSEVSWKATIAEKQLSGEHFMLADKEYALLADKFNIAGIPRYMVIDKKGMIVDDNAPRPSAESLVGLLETLSEK